MFSKIAIKFDEIFTADLTLCSKCQIDGKDFFNFCVLFRKVELYCDWSLKHHQVPRGAFSIFLEFSSIHLFTKYDYIVCIFYFWLLTVGPFTIILKLSFLQIFVQLSFHALGLSLFLSDLEVYFNVFTVRSNKIRKTQNEYLPEQISVSNCKFNANFFLL